MARHLQKILGKKFGMLTVLQDTNPPAHLKNPRNRYALCQCDCGRQTSVRVDHLRRGKTESCGCRQSDVAFGRALRALQAGDNAALVGAVAMSASLQDGALASAADYRMAQEAEALRLSLIPKQTERERQFGMPAGAHAELLAQQGGVCAICGEHQNGKALSIDHCHTTGQVRGLLCHKCNAGLGLFGDDILRIAKAIKYLTDSGKQVSIV